MRVIVAGLGIQGYKRRKHAGKDYVASVDPLNKEAEYRKISDVPLDTFDAIMACIPDEPKVELTKYALSNSKHVLVEKPLWAAHDGDIEKLEQLARKNKVVCYIGYNHRFEPHFVRMRNLILSGNLGEIYSCRMFYGNGTARLVRNNEWRDHGGGDGRAKAVFSPADAHRGGQLRDGLHGAHRRCRPRLPADPRRGGWQRVPD